MSIPLEDSGPGLPTLGTDLIPQSLCNTIMDDDVEAAPIYRCRGKVEKPIRPCMNHDLHIDQEAERPESHCKQPTLAEGVCVTGPLVPQAKSWECNS